jgi:2-phospho-L-lactate guanylyltransferase
MAAALVPVKRLHTGKSRLARELERPVVERLVCSMLEDVVATLRAVPELDPVAVVTPDPAVAEVARGAGARALVLPDPGLNPSLDAAARELSPRALLVMLGDVPGALTGEVAELMACLAELGGRGVVLAPTRDGGTGALLRAPHDLIPNRFGPESAEAHRDLAKHAGVPFRELRLPSLEIDLDTREDLDAFLARREGGPRTRRLLRELGL